MTNYSAKKLNGHPSASASVITYNNLCILRSYATNVIIVETDEDGNEWMICTGTYSATTRKHISYFLRELYPSISYNMAKTIYEQNLIINVRTGEVRDS